MTDGLRSLALCFLLMACVTKGPPTTNGNTKTGPQVPDDYVVEVAADSTLVDFPMFSTLDEYGRLFVFESTGDKYDETQDAIDNPQFRINLLEDTDADGRYDKSTIFADKVRFPQGGVFYKGSLYASSAPDLIKFTDTNSDGVADKREVLLSGWVLNVNANSLVGPSMGPDGWFYMTSAIEGFDVTTREGKRIKGETARIWRVQPDGSGLEWISAGGMNNPVELAYTESAEPIGTETYFTEPQAGERDALVYWIEGGVYPKPNNNIERDKLPLTGGLMPVVSKFSRVAPSGIGRYRHTALGEDFKNNLFSAQFNTHRVLRHKVSRQGGSFRTEDETFFWNNSNEDFHPTDVLEDADGSLLIVETGGWFIKGCPLSQVSKPQLQGAIYRVRQKETKRVDDPYGNLIKWATLAPAELVKYLEGSTPFLADRAQQSLVDHGDESVAALRQLLESSRDADARTKVVFTLYRIGTPEALATVRSVLSDGDEQVSVAATRSVGLSKDRQAIAELMKLVQQGPAPVKRQAATALGQIGDKQAVSALLDASAKTEDRFVRHAIIHALIAIDDVQAVRARLSDTSASVQDAVIIALDQMPGSPLSAKELAPFLTHGNIRLQRTALWAASHHPAWSAEMIEFLNKQLNELKSTASDHQLVSDMLISFGGEPNMQKFIADKLANGSRELQLFLLNAIMKMKVKEFPAVWSDRIALMLNGNTDAIVQAKIIDLIQLRSISSLAPKLAVVADNKKNQATLRMRAIQAIQSMRSEGTTLREAHFVFLLEQLEQKDEPANAQQAAAVLENAALTDDALKMLTQRYVPHADPFILPKLMPAFEGEHDAEIGKALVSTLANSPSLDGYSEESLRKVFEKYPPDVQSEVAKLIEKLNVVHADRIKYLKEIEAGINDGVLDNGRALFFGKATCYTCHKIGSEGGQFGPDLTSIQRDRSTHDLLEAIVYPSVSFVREYETVKVKTPGGEHTGIVKSKTPDELILATSLQSSVRIPAAEIKSMERSDVSMMPQGLDKLLTKKEMADLLTFLLGQDQDPETDERILRHTVDE